jgi:soluble lytic murein transglycosylase-like protein
MTNNMFTIMKRINELKSRFGLNHRPASTREAAAPVRVSYQEFQDKAVAGQVQARHEETGAGIDGIKGANKSEIQKIADHYATANHVPPGLVRAVIEAESNYNPGAVSPKGAKGLMQLMPAVIKDLNVENPFDPGENIKAGVLMLKDLLREYDGDYKKALAAYNAGRRAVNESGGVPDFRETREYVRKVIDAYVKNGG